MLEIALVGDRRQVEATVILLAGSSAANPHEQEIEGFGNEMYGRSKPFAYPGLHE